MKRFVGLLALVALLPGCIATTHQWPTEPCTAKRKWNEIPWRPSFAVAHAEALATKKPLLTVIAAGERNGYC